MIFFTIECIDSQLRTPNEGLNQKTEIFGPNSAENCLTGTMDYRHPNEGINQIHLKIWAAVADKMCFGRTYLRVGVKVISSLGVRSP